MKTHHSYIKELKNKILPILKRHEINRAGIFGSVARNQNVAKSDIDILVELGKDMSLLEFAGIKLELEEALGKKVDLVEYQVIHPKLISQILAEEVRLYG